MMYCIIQMFNWQINIILIIESIAVVTSDCISKPKNSVTLHNRLTELCGFLESALYGTMRKIGLCFVQFDGSRLSVPHWVVLFDIIAAVFTFYGIRYTIHIGQEMKVGMV